MGPTRSPPSNPLPAVELRAQPGTRAPHLPTADGGSTLDLYGESFALLAGRDGREWAEAAKDLGTAMNVEIRPYVLGVDIDVRDGEQAHGIASHGAVLVRPDGFVAWRSRSAATDPAAVLAEVLGSVLARRG